MTYLIGAIVGLVGMLLYNLVGRRSAEALLQNLQTGKKENSLDQNIAKNEGLLQAEEQTRENIEKEKTNEKDDLQSDHDFFNNK